MRELRRLVTEVLADPGISAPSKMTCRLHLAYSEGADCIAAVAHEVGMLRIRLSFKARWVAPDPGPLRRGLEAFLAWERRMQSLIREAQATGVPLLHAEALRTRLVLRANALASQKIARDGFAIGPEVTAADVAPLKSEARHAIAAFDRAGHQHGMLDTKMALADLLELEGDVAGATEIAREVEPVARALGLAQVEAAARAMLEGNTVLRGAGASVRRVVGDEDQDLPLAELNEDDLDRFAAMLFDASNLPPERRPVLNDHRLKPVGLRATEVAVPG